MLRLNLPPVVKHLLIITILFFIGDLLLTSMNSYIPQALKMYSIQSPNFRPYQLITHMFMHGGLMHIFFNMFGIVIFGKVIESVWGSKRFFWLYFSSGLGAAALHLLITHLQLNSMMELINEFMQNPNYELYSEIIEKYLSRRILVAYPEFSQMVDKLMYEPENIAVINQAADYVRQIQELHINTPMVGASGALFGVLAVFAVLFPNVELMLIFLPVPVKAKYMIPGFALLSLFFGVFNFQWDNIAHFAHLGGGIVGFILAYFWKKNQFKVY